MKKVEAPVNRDKLMAIARAIDELINEDEDDTHPIGFALLVFPFDGTGEVQMVTHGIDHDDTIGLLKEFIAELETERR